MSVFIIAEAGSNHAGSLDNAKRLIDLAYNAGAQACKFQYCSNYAVFGRRRNFKDSEPFYPFSILTDWIPELHYYCGDRIEFMSTCYLPEDIAIVAPFVKRFKISNYESQDIDFINAHYAFDKPILISGNYGDGDSTFGLWCVSQYPCPDSEIRLREILEFDGLSDHTKNPITGALAVALDARYIETHFRLSDTPMDCPDYQVARDPGELARYIKLIREAEVLLGH